VGIAHVRSIDTLRNDDSSGILESTRTSIKGVFGSRIPAHRIAYNHNQGFTHLILMSYYDNINNNDIDKNAVYMISYIAETNKYSNYLPIAQKIINSFELTDY
jgi:hypothetical protein